MVFKTVKKKTESSISSEVCKPVNLKELSAKAELALMGKTILVQTEDPDGEIRWIFCYCLSVIRNMGQDGVTYTPADCVETWQEVDSHINHSKYCGIVVNTVNGSAHISLLLEPENPLDEEKIGYMLKDEHILAYVYNATCPECSEMGYIGMELKIDNFWHRVS